MNRKLPMSQGSFSRRDFLRGSSIGLAAAMTSRYGLTMAQDATGLPPDLIPGSPNNPRGWTTTLPPVPE
ncbi:MAG: twin-arginine translocation signal domain-containing protein, partial [Anaerolineaceae bacterium]|nr:twin-arginine translocation signal domain-containing protein [Anaerolineaceae bacterium]